LTGLGKLADLVAAGELEHKNNSLVAGTAASMAVFGARSMPR